jgi:hypothetical protein
VVSNRPVGGHSSEEKSLPNDMNDDSDITLAYISELGIYNPKTCFNLLWKKYIVTNSGFSIHDGTLLHSKSQYTTVKHSRQLL